MKSVTAKWYEVIVKYEKEADNGALKTVSESYAVDALSFSEAEATINKELAEYIHAEFEITAIKIAQYKDAFFSDDEEDDRYYAAKLEFITVNDKGDEKRTGVIYLIQAKSMERAMKYIKDIMSQSVQDYESVSLKETKLMDVFMHSLSNKK